MKLFHKPGFRTIALVVGVILASLAYAAGPKAAKPDASKVKGPASYLPSIEKTYGQPVSHWIEILKQAGDIWNWLACSRRNINWDAGMQMP